MRCAAGLTPPAPHNPKHGCIAEWPCPRAVCVVSRAMSGWCWAVPACSHRCDLIYPVVALFVVVDSTIPLGQCDVCAGDHHSQCAGRLRPCCHCALSVTSSLPHPSIFCHACATPRRILHPRVCVSLYCVQPRCMPTTMVMRSFTVQWAQPQPNCCCCKGHGDIHTHYTHAHRLQGSGVQPHFSAFPLVAHPDHTHSLYASATAWSPCVTLRTPARS